MRRFQNELRNIPYIALGLIFSTVGFNMYLIPNDVAAGGFTGIGQLLQQLFGLHVGVVSTLLNIPLFLASARHMGFPFALRSLISMLLLNSLIDFAALPVATNDILLATVFGGVLSGIGFGLIMRGNATTGGSELLGSLIHRRFNFLKVSVCIFIIDAMVLIASGFVFDQQMAMYALICIFIMNLLVDIVLEGPNSAYFFIIVTNHAETISQIIMNELERGVTAMEGKGMYSQEERNILLCVVNRFETTRLRQIVAAADPHAFVISNRAHDVRGLGFKAHL